VKSAGPSTPVQVLGLQSVPNAGDEFRSSDTEKTARTVAEAASSVSASRTSAATAGAARREARDIFSQIQSARWHAQPGHQGDVQVRSKRHRVAACLERDEVKLAFVHRGVGGITENDISLAATQRTLIGSTCVPIARRARWPMSKASRSAPTNHLQAARGHRTSDGGHARPEFEEVITGEPKCARSSVPASAPSRLPRAHRRHQPRSKVRFLRRLHHLEGSISRSSGSRTTLAKCARASSAASVSATSRTEAGRPHRDLRRARDRSRLMADLEFFFDPVCPGRGSRRVVVEVEQLRSYEVLWRFISLKMINEQLSADWYTPEYRLRTWPASTRTGVRRGASAARNAEVARSTRLGVASTTTVVAPTSTPIRSRS